MFWLFGREACGILASQPGMEPAYPALEGEVLTTGPPVKSPNYRKYNGKRTMLNTRRIQPTKSECGNKSECRNFYMTNDP